MKGKLKIGIIAVAALVVLCGCKANTLTKEDMIPEKLGEPEGLWLYLSNERMRTDGSEREYLFDEIRLDGETVANFSVFQYEYCTDKGTAFFSLKLEEGYCLYLYDYIEKSGTVLWQAESRIRMESSDQYIYVQSDKDGCLYRRDGTLVSSEIGSDFTFRDGLLYCARRGTSQFIWWQNGSLHYVDLTTAAQEAFYYSYHHIGVQNNRFIFRSGTAVYLIDLASEQLMSSSFEGDWDHARWMDGTYYFLTTSLKDEDTNKRHGFRLYALRGTSLRLAFTFPREKQISFLTSGNGYINFLYEDLPKWKSSWNGKYTWLEEGESSKHYYSTADERMHKGSIDIAEEPTTDDVFVCGEYTFSVSSRHYGAWFSSGYCYYLNRKKGDTTEIMQYSFENKGHFFDDIRTD